MVKGYTDTLLNLPDISDSRAKFSYFIIFSASIVESSWVKKTAISITKAVLFSRSTNTKSGPLKSAVLSVMISLSP